MVKDCSCLWDYFMPYPFSIFMPKPHSPLFISQTKKVFSQLRFLYLLNHCLDAALHMVGQFISIWLILKIILSERTFLATQSNRDLKLFLLLLCCIFFFLEGNSWHVKIHLFICLLYITSKDFQLSERRDYHFALATYTVCPSPGM